MNNICMCTDHISEALKSLVPKDHAIILLNTILTLNDLVKKNNEFVDLMKDSDCEELLVISTIALNMCRVLDILRILLSNRSYLLSFDDPYFNELIKKSDALKIEASRKARMAEKRLEELRDE